jgi:hypothetical protein
MYMPSMAQGEVTLVLHFDDRQMRAQVRFDACGQHRHAILISFASPNDDFITVKVDILDPHRDPLMQAQPGLIESLPHQVLHAWQVFENRLHF